MSSKAAMLLESISFAPSEHLYGRDDEKQLLLDALLKAKKASQLVLVYGPSGIGKSALVQQLREPVAQANGYFASGRYEQFQRAMPYRAFVLALRSLLQQLLLSQTEQLEEWQKRISTTLGQNAGLLVPILPELKQFLKEIPPFPKIEPKQARNRALVVFLELLQELTDANRPLVVFLDDLQWADAALLELLEFWTLSPVGRGLLLVLSFRDHDIDDSHPLHHLLQIVKQSAVDSHELQLKPLSQHEIATMLVDRYQCSIEVVGPLASTLWTKTVGNPFFVKALFERLIQDDLLSKVEQKWQWDLGAIERLEVTDNVVALMVEEVERLPEDCRQALSFAACLGYRFLGTTLASVLGVSIQCVVQWLEAALQKGMVIAEEQDSRATLPGEDSHLRFRFAHDRVQEAIYSLLSEADRPQFHLTIGRLLLEHESKPEDSDRLFDIVRHLEAGLALIKDTKELKQFAQLCLAAGQKARESTAFDSAYVFCESGLKVLGSERWKNEYQLTLALSSVRADAALMLHPYQVVEECAQEIISVGRNLVEQLPGWVTRIRAQIMARNMRDALQTANDFLRRAGAKTPRVGHFLAIAWGMLQTFIALRGRTPEDLLALPKTTDPLAKGIMQVEILCSIPYVATQPHMVPVTILRDVRSVLRYGITGEGAQCWTGYGIIHCAIGNIELGIRYGELAVAQVEQLERWDVWARTAFFLYIAIYPWKKNPVDMIPLVENLVKQAHDMGDFTTELTGKNHLYFLLLNTGKELGELQGRLESEWLDFKRNNAMAGGTLYHSTLQTVQVLRQASAPHKPFHLMAEHRSKEPAVSFFDSILELQTNLFLGEAHISFEIAMKDHAFLNLPISIGYQGVYLSYAMIALCLGWEQEWAPRRKIKKRYRRYLRMLKRWAKGRLEQRSYCIMWVEAAWLQCQGELHKSFDAFCLALRQTRCVGNVQEKAFLAEQIAALCRRLERPALARIYSLQAFLWYRQWGATTKVIQFSAMHPEWPVERKSTIPSTLTKGSSHRALHQIGKTIGNWQLTELLGQGGMATVYKAKHQSNGQVAAIKLLPQHTYERKESLKRFEQEAQIMIQLDHPNIIKLYEFDHDPIHGQYIVMELLEGQTLDRLFAHDAPLPLSLLLSICEQLCEALQVTHHAGVVHRDLKPSNVFLLADQTKPLVKLLDFGIAKSQNSLLDAHVTEAGAVIGTPAYLAPEQLDEIEVTPATDVYALAVLCFEALTKQLPHQGETHAEMYVKISQQPAVRLGTLRPEFKDSPLEALLQQALSKEPIERPDSAISFLEKMRQACQVINDPLDRLEQVQ